MEQETKREVLLRLKYALRQLVVERAELTKAQYLENADPAEIKRHERYVAMEQDRCAMLQQKYDTM